MPSRFTVYGSPAEADDADTKRGSTIDRIIELATAARTNTDSITLVTMGKPDMSQNVKFKGRDAVMAGLPMQITASASPLCHMMSLLALSGEITKTVPEKSRARFEALEEHIKAQILEALGGQGLEVFDLGTIKAGSH